MSRENISVRQWQEQFRAGAFDSTDFATQVKAGWHDWWCRDEALAGHLKKIAPVVMGITEPAILDNYYVWFKNNCPVKGPLYDDVRFEPLESERDGRYFIVILDSPHEKQKWTMYSERHDSSFETPEFECGNVREMYRYLNAVGRELAEGRKQEEVKEAAQNQAGEKLPGRTGAKKTKRREKAR